MCQDFELFLTVRALAAFGGGLKGCNEANKLEAQKRGIKEIQKTNKKNNNNGITNENNRKLNKT